MLTTRRQTTQQHGLLDALVAHHDGRDVVDKEDAGQHETLGGVVRRLELVRHLATRPCGVRDAPVPDPRKGYLLYDSTVNDMANPSIFVVYHDAQAYPEYLVKFRQ